jgi:DNA-binding NarL/FixJ family response regulator
VSTGGTIRVLVADDHELVRSGIRQALGLATDIQVVAEAANGRDALDSLETHEVDLCLLDVRMPCLDGMSCLREIVARWPWLRVVMLSVDDSRETALEALRMGAAGYVLKSVRPADLASAIRQVAEGTVFMGGPALAAVFDERDDADQQTTDHSLTERELETLRLVAQGKSNAEIARTLYITPKTVKFHLTHIFAKLGVANRTEAAAYALNNRLAP